MLQTSGSAISTYVNGQKFMKTGRKYLAYMLRIWKDSSTSPDASGHLGAAYSFEVLNWCASLEEPSTGNTHFFLSLDKMFLFLLYQAGLLDQPDKEE
jgi:hypothetical protein